MSIHTQESVSGFITSDPQLTVTSNGNPRLYLRFGQEHFRREEDGTFTQLESSYHYLVMFGRSAERAAERFAKGDNFIAEGYQRPVSYEREVRTWKAKSSWRSAPATTRPAQGTKSTVHLGKPPVARARIPSGARRSLPVRRVLQPMHPCSVTEPDE